jgi:hypothetical protein
MNVATTPQPLDCLPDIAQAGNRILRDIANQLRRATLREVLARLSLRDDIGFFPYAKYFQDTVAANGTTSFVDNTTTEQNIVILQRVVLGDFFDGIFAVDFLFDDESLTGQEMEINSANRTVIDLPMGYPCWRKIELRVRNKTGAAQTFEAYLSGWRISKVKVGQADE